MKSDPDKYTELAENIIKVARNTLIVNLRFMDSAMSRLYSKPYDGTVATDGQFVYFNPIHILKSYKQGKEIPPHIYLHMVMHCVFQHFFIDFGRMDRELWDIACDVAVEAVILDLKVGSVNLNTDHTRRAELNKLKSKCKFLTAECIYRYLLERNESEEELFHLAGKFRFDDHSLWYHPKYGLKTKEEASKLIPEEDQKYLTDDEDGGNWPLYDNDWFNYEEWHSDLEQDEHEYTSAHGDKIHIICAYGYD